jgi:hypothetical protein
MKRGEEMKRIRAGCAMTRVAITMFVLFMLAAPVCVHSSPADDIPCQPPTPGSPHEIDFSGVPPATMPQEANQRFAARARVVTEYNACRLKSLKGKELDKVDGLDSTTVAIAKLEAGGKCTCEDKDNKTQVNQALLNSKVSAFVGTDFQDLKHIPGLNVCDRVGDYDVVLRGLITIMYRYGPKGQNKLWPIVYAHLLHNLLNQRGPHDPNIKNISICGLSFPETENHILMIETSRYLTNQLLLKEGYDPKYDNKANGFNEWMLGQLQTFLRNDFQEYNSRPYQIYTTMAIQNLYDFADDPNVKLAAQMVLEYISAKFAVSSNGLRRAVPFRRLKEHKDQTPLFDDNSDPQTQRFIMLSGLTQRLAELKPSVPANIELRDQVINAAVQYKALDSIAAGPSVILPAGANITLRAGSRITLNPGFRTEAGARLLAEIEPGLRTPHFANFGGRDIMQLAAVGAYRVPDMILDLVMNKSHNSYYQLIKHDGVEIYSSSPKFLITAGGFWNPSAHSDQCQFCGDELNCYKDVGWALPTTLMPSDGGVDYSDFIRIDGARTHSCTVPAVPDAVCPCHKEDNGRRNTCVAPGFACGLNPTIPLSYFISDAIRPARCSFQRGPWTFINATGSCSSKHNYGIYVAVHRKDAFAIALGWTVGFFEATSADVLNPAEGFQRFIDDVLSRNGSLDLKEFEINEYVTVTGQRIRFIPNVPDGNKYNWGIVSIGGSPVDGNDRDITKWSLAEGDIINSDGHSGYLTIDNPFLNQRLILDMRDPLRPKRTEINGVGPSNKVVWVDFNYRGTDEYGTFELPYKTLAEGVRAIPWNGATLKIKAGSGKEAITIDKKMRIETSGGTVTIDR